MENCVFVITSKYGNILCVTQNERLAESLSKLIDCKVSKFNIIYSYEEIKGSLERINYLKNQENILQPDKIIRDKNGNEYKLSSTSDECLNKLNEIENKIFTERQKIESFLSKGKIDEN